MNKKQWMMLGGGFIVLLLVVFLALFIKDTQDPSEKAVKELKKEKEELQEDKRNEITKILGTKDEILTYEEMKDIVKEIEKDHGELFDHEVRNIISDKYGEINGIAYHYGYLVKKDDSEFNLTQVANNLAGAMELGYTDVGDDYEDVSIESAIIPTKSLIEYTNPVNNTDEPEKEPTRVVDEIEGSMEPLVALVNNSDGFVETNKGYVGYPRVINSLPHAMYFGIDDEWERYKKVPLEVDILLKEDTTLKEAIEKYSDLYITVNGEEAEVINTILSEEDFKKLMELIMEDEEDVKRRVDNLGGIKEAYEFTKGYKGFGAYIDRGLLEDEGDIRKEYKELLDKKMLRNTVITVAYEFPLDAIASEFDVEEDYIYEHVENGLINEVDVTIEGNNFKLIPNDKKVSDIGIYYKE